MLFLTLSICLSDSAVFSQTISEQLDGVITDFEFTSDGNRLVVPSQHIIRGPGYRPGSESSAGYETFRLEIEVASPITVFEGNMRDRVRPYHIRFYDEYNEIIAFQRFPHWRVNRVFTSQEQDNEVRFYSFDLYDIPIVVLDKTKRIDILHYTK